MKKISNQHVKQLAYKLGADLCGSAAVEAFINAPAGFHPSDIFPETHSIIVIARKMPEGVLHSRTKVPYTTVMDAILADIIRISCIMAVQLEKQYQALAVPVPSEPYEYWNEENQEGRGILSLKHAGRLAGLGTIGKNTLLINRKYGNRLVLGAILTDLYIQEDRIANYPVCPDNCRLCIDNCPAGAIHPYSVVQKLCRKHYSTTTSKRYFIYTCHTCRSICPLGRI